jgi:hypothetical protein
MEWEKITIQKMGAQDLEEILSIEASSSLTPWSKNMFLNELKTAYGAAELLSFPGIFNSSIESGLSQTYGSYGNHRTGDIQGHHGFFETFPFTAQQIFFRDPAILKEKLRRIRRAHPHFVQLAGHLVALLEDLDHRAFGHVGILALCHGLVRHGIERLAEGIEPRDPLLCQYVEKLAVHALDAAQEVLHVATSGDVVDRPLEIVEHCTDPELTVIAWLEPGLMT